MSVAKKHVLIVGGGLAGLACANRLHAAGAAPFILEASDGVGGRVRTDVVEGFLLDRGFQVFLDAYPEARDLLDLRILEMRPFKPGALVFQKGKLRRVMDVFREPQHVLASALAPIGSIADKLRVALLKWRVSRMSTDEIANHEDLTTETYLQRARFSPRMIDVFFRSFYGGIFLERDLRTSSRMFEFTFKMFSRGSATLPAKGMGEIARQLASRLPAEVILLGTKVAEVRADGITLESGEQLTGRAVVLATDASTASKLLPSLASSEPAWRSVTCLYFAADRSPLGEAIIALNGSGAGLVNNVCVPSDVAPSYAPRGKALISISVLGLPDITDLNSRVVTELEAWFGKDVREWRHLRTERIERALPEQAPNVGMIGLGFREHAGVFVCGDHQWSASIEGAIISGKRTADAILAKT
ncbi:MAG: NAD(P)/FAD-dependent oxidoreductase [Verrucomicrobiaceae bacterium]